MKYLLLAILIISPLIAKTPAERDRQRATDALEDISWTLGRQENRLARESEEARADAEAARIARENEKKAGSDEYARKVADENLRIADEAVRKQREQKQSAQEETKAIEAWRILQLVPHNLDFFGYLSSVLIRSRCETSSVMRY
ncbi:MAG: hypothetical protein LBK99_21785 [Opitutaceae bacterium]|jgi:hypothetical protein|nr:hypothetical protein [Opitutaceae bacterium]